MHFCGEFTCLANHRNWTHLRGRSMQLTCLASLHGSICPLSTSRHCYGCTITRVGFHRGSPSGLAGNFLSCGCMPVRISTRSETVRPIPWPNHSGKRVRMARSSWPCTRVSGDTSSIHSKVSGSDRQLEWRRAARRANFARTALLMPYTVLTRPKPVSHPPTSPELYRSNLDVLALHHRHTWCFPSCQWSQKPVEFLNEIRYLCSHL